VRPTLTLVGGVSRIDNASRMIRLLWQDFFRAVLDGRTSPTSSYKKARSGERRPFRAMENRLREALSCGCSPARIKALGCSAWCATIDRLAREQARDQATQIAANRWAVA
jgi:hypothetical protein